MPGRNALTVRHAIPQKRHTRLSISYMGRHESLLVLCLATVPGKGVEAEAAATPRNVNVLGRLAVALERVDRSADADSVMRQLIQVDSLSSWPAILAGARGDARKSVDVLRRRCAAGRAV